MSYTTLYRKFRPETFEEVKGQDHIVTTLKNQIRSGRIGHAYLFCGTRGTGKTSVAKIFARAVNCQNLQGESPCGECALCRAIGAGASMNVIEIDAASNNGVDNIREIREEVAYPPTEGNYKVYIIDEVHMLSPGAFNALLKTLEEPPAYVIFILATTEVHKIPITILSRCQRYDFKRISIETIAARLRELLDKEGIQAEDHALQYIARMADGSMRDALSLLEQCISYHFGVTLTYDMALEVLGAVDTEVFHRLMQAILSGDVAKSVGVVEDVIMQGRELSRFVTDFIWYLRNLLLIRISDDAEDVLDVSKDNLTVMKEQAVKADPGALIRYIRILSDLSNQLRYASQKRVLLEIAVIKLCKPQMETDTLDLQERIRQLEHKIESGQIPAPVPAGQSRADAGGDDPNSGLAGEDRPKGKEKPKAPIAVPEEVAQVVKNWPALCQKMPMPESMYYQQAKLSLDGDNRLLLVYEAEDFVQYNMIFQAVEDGDLDRFIEKQVGRQVRCRAILKDPGGAREDLFPDLRNMDLINIEIVEED